jgi:hypothetical protein
MVGKREIQEVEEAAEAIGGLLRRAVEATITDRVPDRAREAVGEFLSIDRSAAPGSTSGPAQLLATLTLSRWLGLARDRLTDRPQRVGEVLAWIEENLGKRYRARARYTAPVLESEAGAGEITSYRAALQDDFLATLIWLVAGTVAVYADGDIAWLEALDAGAPPVTSGLL